MFFKLTAIHTSIVPIKINNISTKRLRVTAFRNKPTSKQIIPINDIIIGIFTKIF